MRPAIWLSFAVAVLVPGCGGDALDAGGVPRDAGGESAADETGVMGASDLSSGRESPDCPDASPSSGAPCTTPYLSCQYGDDPNVGCDTVMTCEDGAWASAMAYAGECPTEPPGVAGCPSSYPLGTECTLPAPTCGYPQGLCACFGTWHCDEPGPGCLEPRPAAGSECTDEGLTCLYGCGIEAEVYLVCANGFWSLNLGSGDQDCD